MKLKRNRLISLLLVLAMMLALAPAVFAEKGEHEHTWSAWTASEDGATHTRHCTAEGCDETQTHNADFTGSYHSDADGHWHICAAEGCDLTDTKANHNFAEGAAKCTDCGYSRVQIAVADLGTVGKTASVTAAATVTPDDLSEKGVTWASSNTNVATIAESGAITIVGAGKTTITATSKADTDKSASKELAVKPDKPTITTNLDTALKSVQLGGTMPTFTVAATSESGTTLSYAWYRNGALTGSNSSSYTPDASVLTAGTEYSVYCEITATTADGVASDVTTSNTAKFQIVSPLRVQLNRTYGTSTVGTRASFTATVQKFNTVKNTYETATYGTDYDSVVFTIGDSKLAALGSNSTTTSATSTVYVDLKAAGSTTLTATLYKGKSSVVGTGSADITISTATAQTITQNPTSASYTLLDETQLVNAVYTATRNTSTNPVSYATPTKFVFQAVNGSFSLNGSSSYSSTYTAYTYTTPRVGSVYFVPNTSYGFTSANVYVTYTAYDTNGNAVATGTVKFTGASSISYSASANTAVSFSATDFQTFFKQSMNNSSYATLSYVTFGTPYVSSGSATVGTLYYNNSYIYTNTQVPAASLGYVSYLPSNSLTSYTVSIPFTAYGYNSSYSYGTPTSTASGIVTIKVNDGHVIGMTGTSFQSAGVGTEIYTAYPSASYVRFTLPQSTVGKLYYGYSSIASKGTAVSYTDYFYNTNVYSSTQKSVNNVYFLPAAGCANSVSIGYTVYSSANVALGSGTITFTVNKKTASGYFSDVTASNTGNWSADAIDFLASNSIITGKDSYTFAPKANMTRGDFVLMLYRLAGKPSVSGVSNPFTDVKTTDYYYSAILWAYRNNVVTGVDAKTFAPKKNITREQIAATLYRLAGSPTATSSVTGYYDSSKIHSYALSAMKWAVGNGVLGGSGGYLNPTNNATRAEVAAMLHRYLTK